MRMTAGLSAANSMPQLLPVAATDRLGVGF
jgi:hypothetical protein